MPGSYSPFARRAYALPPARGYKPPTPSKGVGVAFEPETTALIARFTTPPTFTRANAINTLIKALKDAGIWPKLDCLWLMAAADSQAGRQNWIADQYNLTAVASPTFTVDRGYTPDGASSYLRTGFNPSTAVSPKFAQNSASFGFYSLTNSATASQNMGTSNNVVLPRNANNSTIRINNGGVSSTTADGLSSDSSGYFAGLRADVATERLRRNNGQRLSIAKASSAVNNSEFLLCGRNSDATGGIILTASILQTAMGFIGSNLTDGESDSFYAAVLTYLQAVGAA